VWGRVEGGWRAREAGGQGRLEGKGGRGWFRERVEAVEKRVSCRLFMVFWTAFFASSTRCGRGCGVYQLSPPSLLFPPVFGFLTSLLSSHY
jgi:hypothetical protein